MAIYLITGRLGEGKGYVAAALAADDLAHGRRVYADYFLEGARPWLAWEDVGTPAFRGSGPPGGGVQPVRIAARQESSEIEQGGVE